MTPTTPAKPPAQAPRLEPGDHLTRQEFERRYDATPGLKKAELLEGVVHMPPPVRWDQHSSPHADLITWLGVYRAGTPGVRVGADGTLRLDLDNEPQPDAAMIIEPASGGRVRMSADGYVVGAPELVAEVAASSASIDLNTKLRVYRRNGALEYLVWRVIEEDFNWFVLRQGRFEPLPRGADGVYRSETFPGLWLDAAAMVRMDIAAVLAVLQHGLTSPEHSAFVTGLQSVRQRQP
jgi:Uma2 family endonuclease